MHINDQARDIYARLLAAIAASGKPMPSAADAKKWVELSLIYAKAFDDYTRGK